MRWVSVNAGIAMHDALLADHGGLPGIRDRGLLESALARPRNLMAYGTPSLFELAAGYCVGVARNHPFADGNRRAAFAVASSFLHANGRWLRAAEEEAVVAVEGVAAGEIGEEELTAWFERNSVAIPGSESR